MINHDSNEMRLFFQAEVYVNLLDEDIDEFSNETGDDSTADQPNGNILYGTQASGKEDRVNKMSSNVTVERCNNNIKQNGEIQNLLNNETKLSTDYLNGSDIDDELNDNLVAKLLDPFEQLEREFNWDSVVAIKPPSAFSGVQSHQKSSEVEKQVSRESTMATRRSYLVDTHFNPRKTRDASNSDLSNQVENQGASIKR